MTTAATIDATGIHVPTYADVLADLVAQYQGIYGSDVILTPDTQDGQWLGIIAKAITDANSMAAAVYNAFSPSTAQGVGLSRVVKINGIARAVATNSSVDLLLGGSPGTVLTNGYATDTAGNRWNLPASVTVPTSGQIVVTATADQVGAIQAAANSITNIGTPTQGWQTVTNPTQATVGQPVEIDATLRRRQATSTRIPSVTQLEGMIGAVASLSGVAEVSGAENATSSVDSKGLTPYSFALVVDGGDAATIAATIQMLRGVGVNTFGTTTEIVSDKYGIPHRISFSRPVAVPIAVRITMSALAGYTANIGAKIKAAIADYINALPIGAKVYCTRLFIPANLSGSIDAQTYDIAALTISRDGMLTQAQSITLAFNEVAACVVTDIAIIVSS